MKCAILVPLLLLAACDSIPRDPDGTLERIREDKSFKVGLIASGARVGPERQRIFVDRVAASAGARPEFKTAAAEELLPMLETGDLDLVVGPMAPKSPWSKHVTLLPPIGEKVDAQGHLHLVAMARNGENAWISLLYRQARTVAAAR